MVGTDFEINLTNIYHSMVYIYNVHVHVVTPPFVVPTYFPEVHMMFSILIVLHVNIRLLKFIIPLSDKAIVL